MLRLALAVTAAMALLGCAGSDDVADVARDDDGRATEAGTVRADRLRVGDCFDDQDDQSPETFPVVPCDDPHGNEAFFRFTVPGSAYPGQDALVDQGAARCQGNAFREYVGEPIEATTFGVFYVVPSEETWDRYDDRAVLCVLYDETLEPLQGSARG